MELTLILQGAFTGACAGFGCGSTCGSGMGVFLSGYLASHAKGTKDSLRGFLLFYLGKILAVAGICLSSSLLGRAILDETWTDGTWPLSRAADSLMVGLGIFLVIQWFRERRNAHSHSCRTCSMRHLHQKAPVKSSTPSAHFSTKNDIQPLTLLGAGAGYGLTPCAPLLLMAGYAASHTPVNALISGSVFAASSAISPLLILAVLSGVLSGKLKKEIPQYLDWFRLGAYLILIIIFTADML
ncbi:MAG: sulfite exporter TauE/SafE family protein [Eubacteriales bacterium]|nr:sulfite exporter TauE/SafE family protein [Eubacteriales bacterium]